MHYWHDNADVALPWQGPFPVNRANMYVYFTTDHVGDPGTDATSMGRSILARSNDGGNTFSPPLYTMSTDKFINLSIQVVHNADFPGLPQRSGDGVLLWGSGGYRRSNLYLAHIPLESVDERCAMRFYTGTNTSGQPQWSGEEVNAAPLFLSGSIGELCVRWNPFLRRFILMYNGDNNPGKILEHQSPNPWGRWSEAQNIFDYPSAIGHYMHNPNLDDGLSDPGREDIGGGVYGPYIIAPYTTPNPDGTTTMYFVLSTWNPYNTMLMKTTIALRPEDHRDAAILQPTVPPPPSPSSPSPSSSPSPNPGSC
jgi:hypothetical protein